jgi:hypothetical protein
MIFNEWGLKGAAKAVERVAKHGHRRVNFVVTIHCCLDKDLRPQNYGLIRAKKGWQYTPFDKPLLTRFRVQLKRAFAKAARLKLDIAILPHVDAAGPRSGWRNDFDLDPLKVCGGFTYKKVMIDSIADALAASVRKDTEVEFALTGEMGRTVFAYPDSYRKIMAELRKRLKHLQTGVSLNFNKVSGNYKPAARDSAAVQKLLDQSDFLGFSCYGTVSLPPKLRDFTAIIDHFAAELKGKGVTIPEGLRLHFSEVGLGGGAPSANSADSSAREPAQAAKAAWAGTGDPKKNPWGTKRMRDFRRAYHRALLQFLRTQPARWKVTAAFLWNTGSWCPYGFEVSAFADKKVIQMIRVHNTAAAARQGRSERKER